MDYAEQVKSRTIGSALSYYEYLKLKRKQPKVKDVHIGERFTSEALADCPKTNLILLPNSMC